MKTIVVLLGVVLTGSGICAYFQSGILKADKVFYSYNSNYVILFLVHRIDHAYKWCFTFVFHDEKDTQSCFCFNDRVSHNRSSLLLVRGIGNVPVLVNYLVFYKVNMFLSAVCVIWVQITKT